ncbi:MAG: SDR family NAD(P)-dependent oxidoreductase [Hyphomonas sp.]
MTNENIDLTGKVAIVTGAASGIGRASAILFASAGANVVVADLSDNITQTAQEIEAAGGVATAMQMNVGNEEDVINLVDLACKTYGGLDIFYANAGITGGHRELLTGTPELWMDVLRVNLVGPFLAIKHAAAKMRARGGGSIICTASVAGLRSGAGPAQYSASKAGVINLVQTSAQTLAGTGIRVNAICPGLIETGMTKAAYDHARSVGKEDKIGQLNPTQRGGEPSEIAGAALFLASKYSSYVNGQAIIVDGGLSSSHPVTMGAVRAEIVSAAAAMDAAGS